ncbi:hypothetical protein NC652_027078 [Populus alba x Populus x berolinensis]|nr:hypothetical protein NC652_027078 [Populus alba x Populus x berolinensis]
MYASATCSTSNFLPQTAKRFDSVSFAAFRLRCPDFLTQTAKRLDSVSFALRLRCPRCRNSVAFQFRVIPLEHHSSHGTLLLLLYVDDIILTGSHSSLISSVITALSHEFDLTDLGPLHHFLGLQISYLPTGLFVSQTSYVIDLLARQYRSIVGALQYLTFTRPDIAFSAYSDADWAGDPNDRRPISWASKKQHTVSRSSTEAEYRALAITAAELAWIRQLLCDIHIPLLLPPLIHCDNISAISLASNPVFHSRMKHLQIDYHFVRERRKHQQKERKRTETKTGVAIAFVVPRSSNHWLSTEALAPVVFVHLSASFQEKESRTEKKEREGKERRIEKKGKRREENREKKGEREEDTELNAGDGCKLRTKRKRAGTDEHGQTSHHAFNIAAVIEETLCGSRIKEKYVRCRNAVAFEFRVIPLEHFRLFRYPGCRNSVPFEFRVLPANGRNALSLGDVFAAFRFDAPVAEIQLPLNFRVIHLEHCMASATVVSNIILFPQYGETLWTRNFLTTRRTEKRYDSVVSVFSAIPTFDAPFAEIAVAFEIRRVIPLLKHVCLLSAILFLHHNFYPQTAKRFESVSFRAFLVSGISDFECPACRNSVAFEFRVIPLVHVCFCYLFYITILPQTAKRFDSVSFAAFRLRCPGCRNSIAFEFRVIPLEHAASTRDFSAFRLRCPGCRISVAFEFRVIPLEHVCFCYLFYIRLPPQTAKLFDSVSFAAFRLRCPCLPKFSCLCFRVIPLEHVCFCYLF